MIDKQVYHAQHQWLNAALATIFGIPLLIDGEAMLNAVLLGMVSVFFAMLGMHEFHASWHEEAPFDASITVLVGLELGLLAAYVAHRGRDGLRIIAGALLGFLAAAETRRVLEGLGVEFASGVIASVVLYSILVGLGMLLVLSEGHLTVTAVTAPILGGALLTSASIYGATDVAASGMIPGFSQALPFLSPKTGPWIEFFCLLFRSPFQKSEGLVGFVGKPYCLGDPDGGGLWIIPDVLGCWGFWFLLTAGGMTWQVRKDRMRRRKGAVESEAKRSPSTRPEGVELANMSAARAA